MFVEDLPFEDNNALLVAVGLALLSDSGVQLVKTLPVPFLFTWWQLMKVLLSKV